jgi:ferric-dicitrate binding protein FerR (iron transport regulator)
MSTESSTLDYEVGHTTEEIERYNDHQERSARRRRWLLGAGAAVVVAGGAAAVALMFTSSGTTPAVPASPASGTGTPAG